MHLAQQDLLNLFHLLKFLKLLFSLVHLLLKLIKYYIYLNIYIFIYSCYLFLFRFSLVTWTHHLLMPNKLFVCIILTELKMLEIILNLPLKLVSFPLILKLFHRIIQNYQTKLLFLIYFKVWDIYQQWPVILHWWQW